MSAIAWMLLAVGLMSSMDAVAKWLAADYAVAQVVWLRYLFGLTALLPLVVAGKMGSLSTARPIIHLFRAGLGLMVTGCFFLALRALPLSIAVTTWFTAPVFVIVFGAILLKEAVTARHVLAIALGLCGLLVMIVPTSTPGASATIEPWGFVAALAAAAGYALSVVLTRDMAATESQIGLSFYPALLGSVAALPLGIGAWSPPPPSDWLLFALLGCLGSLGYVCMCLALSRERAGALAPYEYTAMVWAAAFDLLVFEEAISLPVVAGAAIIIVSTRIAATGALVQRRASG